MDDMEDISITQDIIKKWLQEKHCTLWQQWDIVSPSGMEEASKWMLEQIISIASYAQDTHGQVLQS